MQSLTFHTLKINPEYAAQVPKHCSEDYAALEASIVENKGAFESIKINPEEYILDGHTRYEICTKHGLGFATEIVKLPTVLDEKIYVIETNLKRRQLNQFQRIQLNLILAPLLAEKGRLNIVATYPESGQKGFQPVLVQDCTNIKPVEKVDSLGVIAEKSHVGRTNVAKVKKILEKAPEKIKKECESGKRSINSAYCKLKEVERIEQRNEALAETNLKLPEDILVYQGDFSKIEGLQPESVQLILTDPPYPEEYLPEWDKLAEFAKKMLVPGGFLIAYCGHFHLPTVLAKLQKHLDYFWIIALAQKRHSLVHSRHVFCDWKPIIIFNKPPLTLPDYFGDLINGNGTEKTHHEWQQGLLELEGLITNFCPKNGVILDPFAGSGTTLIAAKKLGRKSIGIEVNPETFAVMKKRLAEEAT